MPTLSEPVAAVRAVVAACIAVHERLRDDNLQPIADVAAAILAASRAGGKVLVFGNGGSAADAQHLAVDLVGRFQRERRPVAVLALTTDTTLLTAIANDYAFDRVFVRQIDALAVPGDLVFGISTSGRSPNVVEGLRAARARGVTTIAMTGRDGGPAGALADIHINVPDPSTARIQEAHRTVIHAICELVEREL
jgi:D-sedoheptulose 7-phosphate isomerase